METADKLFASAMKKLGGVPLEVLPLNANDNLWPRIREECNLTLWELIQLKNHQAVVLL